MFRWLKRRKKTPKEFYFSKPEKGKPVICLEVSDTTKVRIGYLRSIKNGIMTAYFPTYNKELTAHFEHNNWILDRE